MPQQLRGRQRRAPGHPERPADLPLDPSVPGIREGCPPRPHPSHVSRISAPTAHFLIFFCFLRRLLLIPWKPVSRRLEVASIPANFRRAAFYIDKIFRGAKAAVLPVKLPTTFELAINLKPAKALGLTVPDKLVSTADEVIE